jgi:hypothetical protein
MTQRHLTVPDEYMLSIGQIIFYWATLEHEIVDILGIALKIGKKERRILMAKMEPKARVSMLKVVGSKYVKNRTNRTHINNLAAAALGLYEVRNYFAHGAWCYPTGQPDKYELLVIDSGEAAYLPKRMDAPKDARDRLVSQYRKTVEMARHIRTLVAQEMATTDAEDSEGGVSSGPVTDAPLEVPKDVPHGDE